MSYSGSETHVCDQGNQHNNGPHQDLIFDNPAALCLALWAKIRLGLGMESGGGGEGRVGGTNVPNGLFMKGVGLYPSSSSFCPWCLLCLRSFRSKYNISTINFLLDFFLLLLDLKLYNL